MAITIAHPMIKYTVFTSLFLVFALLFSSCGSKNKKPDVSEIELDIQIERFDREFAQLNGESIGAKNREWIKKYGSFYSDYMIHMLQVGSPIDTLYMGELLKGLIAQEDFKALAAAVGEKYPDMKPHEEELTQAFKYLKHDFPDYQVPRIISFFSGFSIQLPIGEDYIGIGLDMFLGENARFYPELETVIPKYVIRRFAPEYIVPRVMETVIREELLQESSKDVTGLQLMIYEGKVLYALDALLDRPEEVKIGYTEAQLAWAKSHEDEIWAHFVKQKVLDNNKIPALEPYFAEAENTPEFGAESAPKLGSYIGWQIVRRYMEKHPDVSLKRLFTMDDALVILQGSDYGRK